MSTWLDLNNEREVFECPFCRRHVSSDDKNCPQCALELTDEVKQSAIRLEKEKIKATARRYYKPSIYAGIIFLTIGLGIPAFVIFRFGWSGGYWESLVGSFPYIIVGIIALIYGWRGLYKNK